VRRSTEKYLQIWDLESMECIKIIKTHDNTVCSLTTSLGKLFSGSYTEIKVTIIIFHFDDLPTMMRIRCGIWRNLNAFRLSRVIITGHFFILKVEDSSVLGFELSPHPRTKNCTAVLIILLRFFRSFWLKFR
jgi:hypothetical protein